MSFVLGVVQAEFVLFLPVAENSYSEAREETNLSFATSIHWLLLCCVWQGMDFEFLAAHVFKRYLLWCKLAWSFGGFIGTAKQALDRLDLSFLRDIACAVVVMAYTNWPLFYHRAAVWL